MPPPSYNSSGPVTPADCELLASQLVDPATSARRKLDIANELRDSAENNRDFAFYDKYLGALIPALITVLGDEKTISFMKDNLDYVSRAMSPQKRHSS
jgi:transformation/transcription domain-associated protein